MSEVTNIQAGPALAPSATAVRAAQQTVTVVDDRGRRIVIRKVSLLQRLQLIEGLGDAADGSQFLNHALLIASVVSIDGIEEASVQTKDQLKALAGRLETDGFEVVAEGYAANFKKAESGNPAAIKKL